VRFGLGALRYRKRGLRAGEMLKFTIPSDFAAAREVQKAILDEVDRHGFSGQAAFAIKLALEEALINAVKHGNKFDPEKKVEVAANVTAQQAEIIIEDEGPGFEKCDVPDPTLEENLEKCSGRGILLIEAYMNSAEWSNKGRRLRMIKKNEE
jgi:serine/threonine-protein kinase RsbW